MSERISEAELAVMEVLYQQFCQPKKSKAKEKRA